MQISQALSVAREQLHTDSARLETEVLLAHTIGMPRIYLKTWPERDITEAHLEKYFQLIARRQNGEPIAYILGQQEFWSLDFKVNQHTLIPRPETELLVELALSAMPNTPKRILDLGTGTGAIAIAIASERPEWHITAVDVSAKALEVAKHNGMQHQVNIEWIESHWLNDVSGQFDLIISNPPYIALKDPHLAQGDVRFEPEGALVSGDDGLDDIRYLITTTPSYLPPKGMLMIEHGYDQQKKSLALLEEGGFDNIKGLKDDAGNDRIVVATTPAHT